MYVAENIDEAELNAKRDELQAALDRIVDWPRIDILFIDRS